MLINLFVRMHTNLNYLFAFENMKKLTSKVGYFTKTKDFFFFTALALTAQIAKNCKYMLEIWLRIPLCTTFWEKWKEVNLVKNAFFYQGAAWAWCVMLRQPCTVAVFVRNCPNNKVGFLGVAALWVDYMPFPEIRNNGFMGTDLCWKTIQNVLL